MVTSRTGEEYSAPFLFRLLGHFLTPSLSRQFPNVGGTFMSLDNGRGGEGELRDQILGNGSGGEMQSRSEKERGRN